MIAAEIIGLVGDLEGDRAWAVSRLRAGRTPRRTRRLSRLDQLWAQPRWQDDDGDPKPIDVADHVTMLPRAHRWELGGRSFVALGGAPSVNRLQLTEDVDWWPSEVIHEGHVQATLAGGHAEVMLTHDSAGPPYCTEPVADILENNPWGWPPTVTSTSPARPSYDSPALLTRPRSGRLAANQVPGNVRLLDLDTLTDASAVDDSR